MGIFERRVGFFSFFFISIFFSCFSDGILEIFSYIFICRRYDVNRTDTGLSEEDIIYDVLAPAKR